MPEEMFIGFPEATLRENPRSNAKPVKKVLWGDWAKVIETQGKYKKVHCRNATGWVAEKNLQPNRLLEVNFVDVGQGDGCFIATPEDEFILIDAGEGDNMYHFLRWRFNLNRNRFNVPIKHMIISHPDTDHYYGFKDIVKSKRFKIENIYHNGIIERVDKDTLGPKTANGEYLADIRDTHQKTKSLVTDAAKRGRKRYPGLLNQALETQNGCKIQMLEKGDQISGYGKNDNVYFKILGPVTEQKGNKKVLKWFSSDGETKNGHSVIVQLVYGDVKFLLGGDINEHAEEYLTKHYTRYNPHTVASQKRNEMIEKGRKVFESHIAKSCHHGSHKFIDDFLSFIHPVATVISSGDNETHTHPRPDTLGAIGKHSRGVRPLIFSTELARSAKEKIEIKEKDIQKLADLFKAHKAAVGDQKKAIKKEIDALQYTIQRNIAVYGMINVRTDGKRVVIAQKKEAKGAGFIIFELVPDGNGDLVFNA